MSLLESLRNIPNTHIQIRSLGTVEFRRISSDDMKLVASYLEETTSEKEFVSRVLYNQITSPSINLLNIKMLPEEEFDVLAGHIIHSEPATFRYLVNTGHLHKDFKHAIDSYFEEVTSQIRGMLLHSLQLPSQEILERAYSIAQLPEVAKALKVGEIYHSQIAQVAQEFSRLPVIASIVLRGFEEQMAPVAESAEMWGAVHRQIHEQLTWASQLILEGAERYWLTLRARNVSEAKAARILKRFKWLISPSLPSDMIDYVVELSEQRGKHSKAVTDLFNEHFESHNWSALEAMVLSWKDIPLRPGRYKILQDCMYTVTSMPPRRANSANVILPTLLAQIDGLTSDYLSNQGIKWTGDYVTQKGGRLDKFKQARVPVLSPTLDELTDALLLEVIFANTKHSKLKRLHALNRHQVMHGINTRYGRRDYLLRTFMILDSLVHLIKVTAPISTSL